MMRLDKYISLNFMLTRTEAKKALSKGLVSVNGIVEKKPDRKIDEKNDCIIYDGKKVSYKEKLYYMLNKPAGYVSATEDNVHPTVVDLFPNYAKKRVFPVGRLDIDTEGLLLITDDGEFSHRVTSPGYRVVKKYYAVTEGIAETDFIPEFEKGIDLGDFVSKPAELEIISTDKKRGVSEVIVSVTEGRFHQVKRMLAYFGMNVMYLKRFSIGKLELDENLKPGEYRELTESEIKMFDK